MESKRYIKNHAAEGHFCPCGAVATHSCTDAREVSVGLPQPDGIEDVLAPSLLVETPSTIWVEGNPRYGCAAHRVEPMVYFVEGTCVTTKEYELAN
jgi:hypothetical protein